MGYTHTYIVQHPELDLKIPRIASDVAQIIEASRVSIADASGKRGSKPVLGPNQISFNGTAPREAESFQFPPDHERNESMGMHPGWNFCKTDRLPYDIVVCAALVAIQHHLDGNVEVQSNGHFADQEDWQPVYRLYRKALGRDLPEPFSLHEYPPVKPTNQGPTTIPLGI